MTWYSAKKMMISYSCLGGFDDPLAQQVLNGIYCRLMDVLVDAREVLRNDALLLLIQLTKGHANLQKIVAFENAFDKLCDIMETVRMFKDRII